MKILSTFGLLTFAALTFAACSGSKGTATAAATNTAAPESPANVETTSQTKGTGTLTTSPSDNGELREAKGVSTNRVEYVE